jgi:hypothetical protein
MKSHSNADDLSGEGKVLMPHSLPPNPSVRFIQLEAKDILKAHKKGDESTCGTYRLMKRLSDSTDQEILQSAVSLQETQYALSLNRPD